MSHLPIIVVGAGGHGWVVADALLASGRNVIGFVDPDAGKHAQHPLGLPVLGSDAALQRFRADEVELVNGIGSVGGAYARARGITLRRHVQEQLEGAGWRFAGVRHPSAVVSAHATLEPGCQVLAAGVVQAAAHVGKGAIVNTRAVIEHHCLIGAYAHVAPGAVVCGDTSIGEESLVGAGAVVRQGLTIGARVVVGIGAAVTRDVAAGTVVGVPATLLGARSQ